MVQVYVLQWMAWYKVDHLLMPDGCLEVEVENSFQDPFPAQHNIIGVSIQHNRCGLEIGVVWPHKKEPPFSEP